MQIVLGGRRFGTAILIASLALNAVLGGYVAVRAYRLYQFAHAGAVPPLLQMAKRRLPAADQEIFEQALRTRESQLRAARSDYQAALSAATASLTRPDFNEAEFRSAVAAARDKRLRVADVSLDVLLDAVARISPAGRQDLVRRFRR